MKRKQTVKAVLLELASTMGDNVFRVKTLRADAVARGINANSVDTYVQTLVREGAFERVGFGLVRCRQTPDLPKAPAAPAAVPAPGDTAPAATGPQAVGWATATEGAYAEDRERNWRAVCTGYGRRRQALA